MATDLREEKDKVQCSDKQRDLTIFLFCSLIFYLLSHVNSKAYIRSMGIRTQISNKGKQVKTVWGLQSILSQGKSEYQACIRLSANSDQSINIREILTDKKHTPSSSNLLFFTFYLFIYYISIPFYSHVKYYLRFYIKTKKTLLLTVSHTIPCKSPHTLSSLINHQINLTNDLSIFRYSITYNWL